MPILYKNNPMPLDGALFVTNPRKVARRENNNKDRLIRAATGRSLASIKAMKSKDYDAYQDLFESVGGESALKKRKSTKKTRMDKFFAALPKGDVRSGAKKRASSAKKASSKVGAKKSAAKKSSGSKRSKSLTPYQKHVQMEMKKGKSMAQAAASWKAKSRGVKSASASRKGRKGKGSKRNPLVAGSAAQKAADIAWRQFRDFEIALDEKKALTLELPTAAEMNKYNKLKERAVAFDRAAASADSISNLSDVFKLRSVARAGASKTAASKTVASAATPQAAATKAVKQGKVYVSKLRNKCKLEGAWADWQAHQKAREAQKKSRLSNRQYYYVYVPKAIEACVKAGQLTAEEGKALISFHKKRYKPASAKSTKKVSTSTRSTSVAKKRKSTKRSAKKPMSLLSAVNRGDIKASIVKKVKSGSKPLTLGEFRSAFKGCGYTIKQLAAKHRSYLKSFGVAPAKKKAKKASSKKSRAVARGKASKSAISLTYVKKVLAKRSPKGQKQIKGMRLDNLRADLPKIQKYAARLMSKGASKYSAVSKAITYYRSEAGGKRKGVNLTMKRKKGLMQRYNNPRRRNSAVVSVRSLPVVGPLLGSLQPLERLERLNESGAALISRLFGRNGDLAYAAASQGIKFAEVAGIHYGLGKVLDKHIDNVAAKLDQMTGMKGASWLADNAYYSCQGLVALVGMLLGEKVDMLSPGAAINWGIPAFAVGVAFDVGSALTKKSSDAPAVSGVHLNGYGDGGAYGIYAPQTVQLTRRMNPGYGALQMNPRAFGAVQMNPSAFHGLSGADGAMGVGGAAGASSYGSVLFSGEGY